jgi:hypothetical protein
MTIWTRPGAVAEAVTRRGTTYSMSMWRCAVVLPHPALHPASRPAAVLTPPARHDRRD